MGLIMSEAKFCKDCAHFREDNRGSMSPPPHGPTCAAPQRKSERDPVFGDLPTATARSMRMQEAPNTCGREARWFEPKPPKKVVGLAGLLARLLRLEPL
jgi:hypothetical protein